jgi:hypothetical protein
MPKVLIALLLCLLWTSAHAEVDRPGANGRIVLTEDRSYFVNCESGSDSNQGTAEAPWRTIAHAYNVARNTLDLAGRYSVYVRMQTPCSGQSVLSGPLTGQRTPRDFTFVGDCTDIARITIAATRPTQNLWYAHSDASFAVRCMTVVPADGGSGFLTAGGTIWAGDIAFAGRGAAAWVNVAGPRAIFRAFGPLRFLDGATVNIGFVAEDHSQIELPVPLICVGAPQFGTFVQADLGGMVDASGAEVQPAQCRGIRYRALSLGIVFTGGTKKQDFFPGNEPGSIDRGYYE